jgi:hypothetical protein
LGTFRNFKEPVGSISKCRKKNWALLGTIGNHFELLGTLEKCWVL